MARHNNLRDRVVDLSRKAFTPSHVRDDPLIFVGCAVKETKAKPVRTIDSTDLESVMPSEATEHKGDLLICDLWQNSTDSVHYMRIVKTYTKSHEGKTPEKCLQEADIVKKRIYLEACLQQSRNFSPFVALVDGLTGVEATETLKGIACHMSTKWRQPYSKTCGYVKSRIAITLVRATNLCIWGSRVPAHPISVHWTQWEDGAGLNLFS